MAYLNTYQIWQCYGGPEEGGWWYEAGTPVQSIFLGYETADDYIEARKWEDIKDLREKTTVNYTEGRCLLYTSPSPRDRTRSRMPSSA